MRQRDLSLGWLLAPLTVDTFLCDIWGTTHHHVSRDSPGYFDSLLDVSASVDELVGMFRPDLSLAGLVRGGDKKQPYLYRRADGGFDADRVGKTSPTATRSCWKVSSDTSARLPPCCIPSRLS